MARHGKGIGCINVGMMQAGEGRNVIPVHAQVQLEVRQGLRMNLFVN